MNRIVLILSILFLSSTVSQAAKTREQQDISFEVFDNTVETATPHRSKKSIPKWDISANSNNVFFVIKEYDPDQTITETEYHSFTYNKNFNWKVDISAEGKADSVLVKGSLGIGGGNNQQTVETNQIVINTSLGSDFIGSGDVAFMQKILEHPMTEEIDGEIVDGFSVRSIDFGNIIVTLLPEDVRY